MNGVRFDTGDASFIIDGLDGKQSDLSVGHTVVVEGKIDRDGLTGKAEVIRFDTNILGPVSEINLKAASLLVLGQVIVVDDSTQFGDGLSLLLLQKNQVLQVSGHVNKDGSILATRIDLVSTQAIFEISAALSELDTEAKTFVLNKLTVDYSQANVSTPLSEDVVVEVKGTAIGDNAELLAEEVNIVEALAAPEKGENLQIEGVVTRYVDLSDFYVSGFPVSVNGETIYTDGKSSDIASNVALELKGKISESGQLVAEKIQFLRSGSFRLAGVLEGAITAEQDYLVIKDDVNKDDILALITINSLTVFIDQSAVPDENFALSDITLGEDYIVIEGYPEPGNNNSFTASRITRKEAPAQATLLIEGVARNVGSAGLPACSDNLDNDKDGQIDFPHDVGCSSAADTDEMESSSNGFPIPYVSYSFDAIKWGAEATEITDSSPNQHHGVPVAMTSQNSVAGWSGNALAFSGVVGEESYVDLGKFNIEGAALTISAWVFFDDFSSCVASRSCYLVYKAKSDEVEDWSWGIRTNQFSNDGPVFATFFLKTSTGTIGLIGGEVPLVLGEWIHLAGRYDGSKMHLFINGNRVTQTSQTGAINIDAETSVLIGRPPVESGGYFDGKLDEINIFSSSLSDLQMRQLAGKEIANDVCNDGIDNDKDGFVDFPSDPGCDSEADNDEFNALGIDKSFTILDYQIIVSDLDSTAPIFNKNGNTLTEDEFMQSAPGRHVRAEIDFPPALTSPIKPDRITILD